MEETISKEELKKMAEDSNNPVIEEMAKQKIAQDFQGDEVAQKMLQLSQILSNTSSGGSSDIDEAEVKKIVKETIETDKITLNDLDSTVKSLLQNQPTQVTFTIKKGSQTTVTSVTIDNSLRRPLIQKLLSDVLARNNSYLYGGAGTGKTFSAKTLAQALGWNIITVNCNQFTSSLELIGGQTIDGYQEGKVIRAFANLKSDGSPMGKGCVLLLDELPKLDPNTAGILNNVLASVGEYQLRDGKRVASSIQNAKGDEYPRGKCFIMATGNSLLNTKDAEYEANFKQDLSLQDRFVGSTYEVFVNEKFEWEDILLKNWAFIFIYLSKLRKIIKDEGFTSKAFVSIRLMQSVQKTYNVYRSIIDNTSSKSATFTENAEISFTPADVEGALKVVTKSGVKTVKESMDEFFNLFTEEQRKILKDKSEYEEFLQITNDKDKLSLSKLNTKLELEEVEKIING
tara:strand:+ start:290 stop:1660 length:1371 start_codon:yes stop_codon:yes gene_type:complete